MVYLVRKLHSRVMASVVVKGALKGALEGVLRVLLLGGLAGLATTTAQAEEVQWLYQVEVPVASQSVADRQAAAGLALTEVLQRVSGQAGLPDSTRLRLAVSQPDRYYDQFRYQRSDIDGSPVLRVDFSAPAVNELSKSLELPLWWANRPRVMLWSLDQGGSVIDAQYPEFARALLARSRQRGVPVVLPMADESGAIDVSTRAIEQSDFAGLSAYSLRYQAELIAAGKITGTPGNLAGRWLMKLANRTRILTARGADAAQVGSQLADKLADMLAARFAVVGTAGEIKVLVAGVSNPRQYAQLLQYLGSLAFVDDTSVTALAGGKLTLALQTQASQDKFLQLLAVDGRLVPEDSVDSRIAPRQAQNPRAPLDAQDPLAGGQVSVAPSLTMRWLGSPRS